MILITGANGHIGRRLIEAVGSRDRVRALVRSPGAAAAITGADTDVRIVDYLDPDAMTGTVALPGSEMDEITMVVTMTPNVTHL